MDREVEIARKVHEIHGQRKLEYGDHYIVPPFDKVLIATNEYDLDLIADGDVCIWIPSPLDYMKMLWKIDADRFILSDDGVYEGETKYEGDEWRFPYDGIHTTPAEAWWKVISR